MRSKVVGWLGVLGLLMAGVAACGDEGGGGFTETPDGGTPDGGDDAELTCNGPRFEGEVASSPWALEVGEIARYRYSGASNENPLRVDALDAAGEVLLTMVIRQVPEGGEDGLPGGAMDVRFDGGELGEGTLWTTGQAVTGGYQVATRLQTPEGEVRTEAHFAWTRCLPPEGADGEPGCVAPLAVGRGGVSVHECGVDAWLEESGRAPELEDLIYIAPGQRVGPGLRREGAAQESVLRVYDRRRGGEVASPETIAAWGEATGAGRVLGSPLERRVMATYLDSALRRRVEEHARRCEVSVTGQGLSADGMRVRAQGLDSSSGSRNQGTHTTSKPSDGEKLVSDLMDSLNYTICVPGTGCKKSGFGASSRGEPHLTTLDGLDYDFQGVGEFVLARLHSGARGDLAPLEIQARLRSVDPEDPICRSASVTTRLALRFAGEVWEIDLEEGPTLYRGGVAVDPASVELGEGWGLVSDVNGLALLWPDGVRLEASYQQVSLSLPVAYQASLEGLFGRYDLSRALYGADGTRYDTLPIFEDFYGVYGEGWRVDAVGSLFTYAPDQGPESFHRRDLPEQALTLASLPDARRTPAEATCEALGLTDPRLMEQCIIDVVCMGPEAGRGLLPAISPASVADPSGLRVEGPGRVVELAALEVGRPPESAGACAAEREPMVSVFEEREALTLGASVAVDLASPGRLAGPGASAEVPAGAEVRVYSAWMDALAGPGTPPRVVRITFPAPVVGVIASEALLRQSDGAVGAQGRAAEEPQRGVEWEVEQLELSPDRRSLLLRLDGLDSADQVRVLTELPR